MDQRGYKHFVYERRTNLNKIMDKDVAFLIHSCGTIKNHDVKLVSQVVDLSVDYLPLYLNIRA